MSRSSSKALSWTRKHNSRFITKPRTLSILIYLIRKRNNKIRLTVMIIKYFKPIWWRKFHRHWRELILILHGAVKCPQFLLEIPIKSRKSRTWTRKWTSPIVPTIFAYQKESSLIEKTWWRKSTKLLKTVIAWLTRGK